MNRTTLKVNICDDYEPDSKAGVKTEWLKTLLADKYELVFCDAPDFLFCSNFGVDFLRYENCVKIFFYTENFIPDFNYYDYAIGMHDIKFGDRHLYIPYYYQFLEMPWRDRSCLDDSLARRKFCNFIYWNDSLKGGAGLRQEFCKKLAGYKHVDCPGRVLNNMSNAISDRYSLDWVSGKIDFIRNYKFTIAFENNSQFGYTTEKLYQPFMADSIPIYWGNPDVTRDFNPKAFINCNDYDNDFDAVIKRVVELDNDDEQYMRMLRENPLNETQYENYSEKIKNYLVQIIERGNKPFFKTKRWSVEGRYFVSHENIVIARYYWYLLKYYTYKLPYTIFGKKRLAKKVNKYMNLMDIIKTWRRG